jgi:uncharacterized iron-regulated protein
MYPFKKNNMSTSLRLFVLIASVCLSNMSFGQLSEKNYKIYSVKAGKEVTLNDIAEDMKTAQVLFYGEEHNDSVTHYLENKMLVTLHQMFGATIALSMEMFDRDVQPVMNEYLNGDIREKYFIKDAKVWSNYKDYKPMVEFAKANKLDVVCANAPSRYTNIAGRKGEQGLMSLSPESKKFFAPLPYDTASGKYYEKLMNLTSHDPAPSTDTTKKMVAPMGMGGFNLVLGQSLWDATMAYSIAQYLKVHKDKKLMQVNGRFHSDEGFAIVTQLKKYSPKTKVLIISTGSDESFPNINWNDFKTQGDYIIVTDPNIPKTFED